MVEEAGEVLEGHILTALTERKEDSNETDHLILIGDHFPLSATTKARVLQSH